MDDSIAQGKECRACHIVLSYTEFSSNQRYPGGYGAVCKGCRRLRSQEQRESNRLWIEEEERKEQEKRKQKQRDDHVAVKQCVGCQENKPLEDFVRFPGGRFVDRHPRCRSCENFAAKNRKQIQREKEQQERIDASLALSWEERVKQKHQRQYEINVKRKYGMTPDRYMSLLKDQGGLCAICGSTKSYASRSILVIDHSHVTGAIRGLLCSHCNTALGFFQDSIKNLEAAIEYLRKFQWD